MTISVLLCLRLSLMNVLCTVSQKTSHLWLTYVYRPTLSLHQWLRLRSIQARTRIQQPIASPCASLVLFPVRIQLRLHDDSALALAPSNFLVAQQLGVDGDHRCFMRQEADWQIHDGGPMAAARDEIIYDNSVLTWNHCFTCKPHLTHWSWSRYRMTCISVLWWTDRS